MKRAAPAAAMIVISDVDGTLLDQQTYSYEASRPAIQRLQRLKIPLILCSSKTGAEMRRLWEELELRDPFILENGGAIVIPPGYFPFAPGSEADAGWRVIQLGRGVADSRTALAEAASRCRARIRSFGTMSLSEIAAATSLTLEQSRLAAAREYDEPFSVTEGDEDEVVAWLAGRGLVVVKGDRFHHLTDGADKGKATRRLIECYRRTFREIFSIGLGNSANDLPLLASVNFPVLVRNPDGRWDPMVESQLPHVAKSTAIGPAGWREMIERILKDRQRQR